MRALYQNNPFLNPYANPYQQNFQKQEILKVNGKNSVNNIQLAPNSSVIAMDTTAPLVWLCVSDSVGTVTATPYSITEYKEELPVNMADIETRITNIENKLEEMSNAKPDVKRTKSKLTEE